MLLSIHFITSVLLATFLYPFYGLNSLFVLIGGFLIDIDHYLYTLLKFKNLSIIDSYKFYTGKRIKKRFGKVILLFHNIEFLSIMTVLSFFSNTFYLITLGVMLHYFLDFIEQFFVLGKVTVTSSIVIKLFRNRNESLPLASKNRV